MYGTMVQYKNLRYGGGVPVHCIFLLLNGFVKFYSHVKSNIGRHLGNPSRQKLFWGDFYYKSPGVCYFSWDSPLCPLLYAPYYIYVIGPEEDYLSLYRIKYPTTEVVRVTF